MHRLLRSRLVFHLVGALARLVRGLVHALLGCLLGLVIRLLGRVFDRVAGVLHILSGPLITRRGCCRCRAARLRERHPGAQREAEHSLCDHTLHISLSLLDCFPKWSIDKSKFYRNSLCFLNDSFGCLFKIKHFSCLIFYSAVITIRSWCK